MTVGHNLHISLTIHCVLKYVPNIVLVPQNDNNIKTTTILRKLHIYLHMTIFPKYQNLLSLYQNVKKKHKLLQLLIKICFYVKCKSTRARVRWKHKKWPTSLHKNKQKRIKICVLKKEKQQCMHNSSPQQQTQGVEWEENKI